MNFMAMIGKASLMMDWEHHTTSTSEDIKVFATIFPKVCHVQGSCSFLKTELTMRYRTTAAWSSRSVIPTLPREIFTLWPFDPIFQYIIAVLSSLLQSVLVVSPVWMSLNYSNDVNPLPPPSFFLLPFFPPHSLEPC